MQIFKQLAIVFTVCFLGKFVCYLLPFQFPASVMGMVLMFLLLFFKVISLRDIKRVSEFLLSNMAFFFIPAGVGILVHYEKIVDKIAPLLLVCIITTLVTFLVTAYTIMFVVKFQKR